MTQTHRTTLFVLALTFATFACSGPKTVKIEQPQEPTAVQDTVKQDSIPQETVATVEFDTVNVIARDTLSQKEYRKLLAALKPKINTKQRQRKKANAPSRQGYDYNLLNIEGDQGANPFKNVFPDYTIGLYGNVERVTATSYTIEKENGIYFKQKSSECLYELNERGDFTRIIHSEPDKRDVILLLCKYDKYGNMTYCKGEEYGNQREWTAKYRYDDEGKLIAKTKTANSYTENSIFQYDRNGKLIKELDYDEQDKLTSCKRYGPNGKLIEELGYDDKDSLISHTKYDSEGRVILRKPYSYTLYWNLADPANIAKYKYNKKGAYTYFKNHGWVQTEKYDSQGRVIESKEGFSPSLDVYSLSISKYDSRGNLIYMCVYPAYTEEGPEVHDNWSFPIDIHAKYDAYNRLIRLNGRWKLLGDKLKITNKYDAKGNLILVKSESRIVAIKYDSQGNAVQKIEYQVMENVENKSTKREIWPISIAEYKIVYRK